MKAAVYYGNHAITLDEVPDPVIKHPTDAIVDIEYAGVCGSDLWTYRGQGAASPNRIGHEFVGYVRETGHNVKNVKPGDWVIAPFKFSDGTCDYCRKGLETSCVHGGFWGMETDDGGQGESVLVPFADGTLVKALPSGNRPETGLVPSLLTLADVFTTGYHAASCARFRPDDTVTVVGDGAVGLCAIMSAKMMEAGTVLCAGSTHADRNALAKRCGADEIITERGEKAVQRILDATGGKGSDAVLECVGSAQSFSSAISMCKAGGTISYVGFPHGVKVDASELFFKNISITGGLSPAHHYIAKILPSVLDGTINPGLVYTKQYSLQDIADAYDDMDNRRTIKALIRVR